MKSKFQPSVRLSNPTPQVVQRIKAMDNETRLLVVDPETNENLRSLRLTATEEMAVLGIRPPFSSSPPATSSSPPSSAASSPSKKPENGSVSKQPVTLSSQVPKPTRRSPSKAKKVNWQQVVTILTIMIIIFVLTVRTFTCLQKAEWAVDFGSLLCFCWFNFGHIGVWFIWGNL